MGRPPCCDKVGIKKGPWTPEEDIILVSYIQEHGPGNWRSVPTNTGLLRCSKSCRLRWTNYLRPGIKRGNFTPHEEGMIIHLQALLGNKWAAIASYLPQRTDNDIKNYWNTHLKKKIKKYQSSMDPLVGSNSTTSQLVITKKNLDYNNHATLFKWNQTNSTYASSTENISRLLEGWMKSAPKGNTQENSNNLVATTIQKVEQESCDPLSHEEFDPLLTFDSMGTISWDKSSSDSPIHGAQTGCTGEQAHSMSPEIKISFENQPPLEFLENWLLDESGGQVEGMEMSSVSADFSNM